MRLICPNCVAQYEVDEDIIPREGRDVQCANCGHNWFQDALQMLSSEAEIPSGTGDPDSDVPPELFNDLEGKLDTSFVSARTDMAPDPNDMEPQNPRDDFQIEQQPAAPSSKLGQDALDILHAEAEFSSGEKPPAATDEQVAENPVETAVEQPAVETETSPDVHPTPEAETQPQQETPAAEPSELAEQDDLDEIRRRIMDLETQESEAGQPETVVTPAAVPDKTDDIIIPDLDAQETPTPQERAAPRTDNPFSRPSLGTARRAAQSTTPAEAQYEENIPVEEDITATASAQSSTVDDAIEDLAAEQVEAEIVSERPVKKTALRRFPDLDADGTLYDTIDELSETRSDMFPDVDELSSEIAYEADHGTVEHQPAKAKTKPKSSFFKGFKYAIYLCAIISALYMFQPVIVEYIPQTAGVLTVLTELVDNAASQIGPLMEKIKALVS